MKRFFGFLLVPLLLLCVPVPASSAQTCETRAPETRSDVELPLSTYDQLRLSAKGKPEPKVKAVSFASARLLRSSLTVDLERRRAIAWWPRRPVSFCRHRSGR
jgi:hypothetical protein